MNRKEIEQKIKELEERVEDKRQKIVQAGKIIDHLQIDITMIEGALVEFKKMLA